MTVENIIPGLRIGSCYLCDRYKDVINKLGNPEAIRDLGYGVEFLEYSTLSVGFNNNVVYIIVAKTAFAGCGPRGIRPGMRYMDIVKCGVNLEFNDDEGLWYVHGIDGFSIDIVRPPRDDERNIRFSSDGYEVVSEEDWMVDVEYKVDDPESSFVESVAVHNIKLN